MSILRIAALVLVVLSASCGGKESAPAAPTPTPVPACQTNNTATVTFENRFTTGTFDVIWDGAKLLTLSAGMKSQAITVAAGVGHSLVFQWTNTNTWACVPGTPVPGQCSSHVYYCPS